jgi:hypothetical protein
MYLKKPKHFIIWNGGSICFHVLVEFLVLGLLLLLISPGFSESVKMVTTNMSLPSKAGLKNNKHGPNDRGSNVGKPVSQVCVASFFVFVDNAIDTYFLTTPTIREDFQLEHLLLWFLLKTLHNPRHYLT